MNTTEPIWLTTQQAAVLIGVSTRCLNNWRSLGKGPSFYRKGTKLVHYLKSEVLDWIETRKETHPSGHIGEIQQ